MLIVRYSVELTAARFGLSVDRLNEVLTDCRAKLAEVRKARPPPHLDSKMLASWNGRTHATALICFTSIPFREAGRAFFSEVMLGAL